MKRFQDVKWVAAAIVAAALIVPNGALSAVTTQLATLANKSGTRTVSVTAAHQLLASDSDPTAAVNVVATANGAGSCQPIFTVPAGEALVIKTVVFTAVFDPSDTDGTIDLTTAGQPGQCNGTTLAIATLSRSMGLGQTMPEDLGGEVVVPQNTEIDLLHSGISVNMTAQVHGYTIPAAAAPAAAS